MIVWALPAEIEYENIKFKKAGKVNIYDSKTYIMYCIILAILSFYKMHTVCQILKADIKFGKKCDISRNKWRMGTTRIFVNSLKISGGKLGQGYCIYLEALPVYLVLGKSSPGQFG